MINRFRDQMPRPIVGIGHSVGALQMFEAIIPPLRHCQLKCSQSEPLDLTSPASHNSSPDRTNDTKVTTTRLKRRHAYYLKTRYLAKRSSSESST